MAKTFYPELIDFVRLKLKQGKSPKQFYEESCVNFNYGGSLKTFNSYVSNLRKRIYQQTLIHKTLNKKRFIEDQFLDILEKQKIISIDDMCFKLNCSPQIILEIVNYYRSKGKEIILDENYIHLSIIPASNGTKINQLEDKEIIFGVASDLHFGSKCAQITALNKFAEICRYKNVKYMFCPGDVCAGYNVYPGQQFEVYALSAKEQEDSVIKNLPTGFEWYAIGGNHDYSFIKRGGGHNPLLSIESQRKDFHYVGFDDIDVPILNGVDLKMVHPSGGVPYSISYRLQKGIEQISYSELSKVVRNVKDKPTIRFVLSGHLHIQMQAIFGSIFGCQCGCFEGQTNYLKRKGLFPNIGGYIIKAELGRNGLLKNYNAKFYIFEEIEDDWKNYQHNIKRPIIKNPIMG